MGCGIAKLLRRGDPEDKQVATDKDEPLPEPPPPASPDPRLPLTARQKFGIVKSWKGINRAIQPTGVNMFLKLFEDNVDILNLFDKFKELETRDAQAESLELAEHASIVMNSIDEGIRSMENVDFFFDLLHQIGASHRRLPGFKKEYFWKIEGPFLDAVKLTLDERYTENIQKVYKITIRFIIETVIQGYDMAEGREVNDNVKEPKFSLGGAARDVGGDTSPSSPTCLKTEPSTHETVNAFRMNIKSGANAATLAAAAAKTNSAPNAETTQTEKSKCL